MIMGKDMRYFKYVIEYKVYPLDHTLHAVIGEIKIGANIAAKDKCCLGNNGRSNF